MSYGSVGKSWRMVADDDKDCGASWSGESGLGHGMMNIGNQLVPGAERRLLRKKWGERTRLAVCKGRGRGHRKVRVQGNPIYKLRLRVRLAKALSNPLSDRGVAGSSE